MLSIATPLWYNQKVMEGKNWSNKGLNSIVELIGENGNIHLIEKNPSHYSR